MDNELKPSTKINNPMALGQYLLKERKSLKLTQKEISEFADVGRKFILEFEKGKTTVLPESEIPELPDQYRYSSLFR